MKLVKLHESTIYENPMPVLRSAHSCFPYVCEMDDGKLLATHVIGQAFESVDGTTYVSESLDKGKTFSNPIRIYNKEGYQFPVTDSLKMTNAGNGHLLLFGYEFIRENPDLPISNPETGGALPSRLVFMESFDYGKSYTAPRSIDCRWREHVEASAPITILSNGDYVSPIAAFPQWDGSFSDKLCSRLIRSRDKGRTWDDDTVIMSLGNEVSMYEQRMTVLEKSKSLVCIAWNENLNSGERLNNHYAISTDNGISFQGPFDTGVRAQSSSVCAIGDDRLVAFHAVRRDTDQPKVIANIVNLENGKWEIEHSQTIWTPNFEVHKDHKMAEVFSMLKFGQPGGVLLSDNTLMFTLWVIEQNRGRTICIRFKIEK